MMIAVIVVVWCCGDIFCGVVKVMVFVVFCYDFLLIVGVEVVYNNAVVVDVGDRLSSFFFLFFCNIFCINIYFSSLLLFNYFLYIHFFY